jgi:hypothetical protein
MRPSAGKRRLLILVLAILGFCLAYYAGQRQKQHDRVLPQIDGVLINPPLAPPDFELRNQAGEPVSTTDLEGHWSLLMLDPSHETAPSAALTRLIQVHNRMARDPELQRQMRFFYLPAHGDREHAISFAAMSDNIHALYGEPGTVDKLFAALGGNSNAEQDTLYLIGPNARVHALFTRDEDAATIADDLSNLISAMQ